MTKRSTLFAALAIACAIGVPAFAQTTPSKAGFAVATAHQMPASKMLGMAVMNDQNQTVGKLVDVMLNDASGQALAIVSVGDFVGGGPKLVAVPLGKVAIMQDRIMMAGATKEMLAAMAPYDYERLSWING